MNSTQEIIEPPRLTEYSKPKPLNGFAGLLTGIAAVLLAVLFLLDPVQHSFYPVCPFHKLTGLNCPGCGSTRAMHEMLHGHILAALRCNALVMLTLPFVMWMVARHLIGRWRGQQRTLEFQTNWLWIFLGVTIVFTVLRNLPQFAWLSP